MRLVFLGLCLWGGEGFGRVLELRLELEGFAIFEVGEARCVWFGCMERWELEGKRGVRTLW